MFDQFVAAQHQTFATALAELEAGEKKTHWMWFIFPQIAGLGMSDMSRRFAIASLAEARDYLDHGILGPRLVEATDVVLMHAGHRTAHDIFGSPDDMKFHASMTLFARAAPGREIFLTALAEFFDGQEHRETLERI